MESHECKYSDKIVKMGEIIATTATDVKWIKQNAEALNGKFLDHIGESNDFRAQVTRNTIWRHVFKLVIGTVLGIIGWIVTLYVSN